MAAYLETWLERKKDTGRFRPSNALHAEHHLRNYWIPLLGHRRLADLTVEDVDRALASIRRQPTRGRRLSPSSVRRIHATVRSALNDAVRPSRPDGGCRGGAQVRSSAGDYARRAVGRP